MGKSLEAGRKNWRNPQTDSLNTTRGNTLSPRLVKGLSHYHVKHCYAMIAHLAGASTLSCLLWPSEHDGYMNSSPLPAPSLPGEQRSLLPTVCKAGLTRRWLGADSALSEEGCRSDPWTGLSTLKPGVRAESKSSLCRVLDWRARESHSPWLLASSSSFR